MKKKSIKLLPALWDDEQGKETIVSKADVYKQFKKGR